MDRNPHNAAVLKAPHMHSSRPDFRGSVRSPRPAAFATALAVVLILVVPASAAARLAKPALVTAGNGASVQQLRLFSWGSVRNPAQYDFEISADRKFSSSVKGFGGVDTRMTNTAI